MSVLPASLCSPPLTPPPRQQTEFSRLEHSQTVWHFPLFFFLGGLEPKKSTYVKSKTRTTTSQQKEQTRLQLANCKAQWNRFIWHILGETWAPNRWLSTSVLITFMMIIFSATQLLLVRTVREVTENVFRLSSLKVTPLNGGTFMIGH